MCERRILHNKQMLSGKESEKGTKTERFRRQEEWSLAQLQRSWQLCAEKKKSQKGLCAGTGWTSGGTIEQRRVPGGFWSCMPCEVMQNDSRFFFGEDTFDRHRNISCISGYSGNEDQCARREKAMFELLAVRRPILSVNQSSCWKRVRCCQGRRRRTQGAQGWQRYISTNSTVCITSTHKHCRSCAYSRI